MKSSLQKQTDFQTRFLQSQRTHVVMITNHGMHNWNIIPGLPDTGGQNVFVNQLSQALADNGCRITVFNRGGYPHPVTGENREGIHYKDEYQRLVFLTDNTPSFIPKEQMAPQIPKLVQSLLTFLSTDPAPPDLIISHYWDGAEIGRHAVQKMDPDLLHIWVPHSLGQIKKRNVSADRWDKLAIEQRIEIEAAICTEVDAVVSTSSLIKESLQSRYYNRKPVLDLPPCIDTKRFYPREIHPDDPIWTFLSNFCPFTPQQIRSKRIITEISRTDSTKRKDILVEAFLKLSKEYPDILLVTSIDPEETVGNELMQLIRGADEGDSIAILSNVYDQLPDLYAISCLYCTPSIMEGFGMSAQEAAATGIPVVASDRVPFAVEVLLGENSQEKVFDPHQNPLLLGEGSIVVPADNPDGFTSAMAMLLEDERLRSTMGKAAYEKTIPAFSWAFRISGILNQVNALQTNHTGCGES